ncbi:MAG TPA: hypothetical protein VE988_02775 [Gemmataceae bacterium]|nr:hypothetical protein [Gemmataceae bacterium]
MSAKVFHIVREWTEFVVPKARPPDRSNFCALLAAVLGIAGYAIAGGTGVVVGFLFGWVISAWGEDS